VAYCVFSAVQNPLKIKKIVSFQGREMVYNKNSIVSSIGKTGNFLKNIRDSAFLYCQNLADLL